MHTPLIQRTTSSIIAVMLIFTSVLPTSNADMRTDANDTPTETIVMTEGYAYDIKIINLTGTSEQPENESDIDWSTYKPANPMKTIIMYYTEDEVIALAKTLYDECRGVKSMTEQACVAWTACNRVDNGDWGDTFIEILEYPNAFAYNPNTKVTPELYELAKDVLSRWNAERNGDTDIGRVLPPDYMYFHGDGEHNYFRNAYNGDYQIWDYSLESPYET